MVPWATLLAAALLSSASPSRSNKTRRRPIAIYGHPPSFQDHPLYRTKAVRPPEMAQFGRASSCAGEAFGCTGFVQQLYTSQNVTTGQLLGNHTAQLEAWLSVANIFTPSGVTLFAPNFREFAAQLKAMDVNVYSFSCEWAFRFLPGQGYDPFERPEQCAPAHSPMSLANLQLAQDLLGDLYLGQGVEEHDLPGCVGQYSAVEHGLFVAPEDRAAQHLAFMDCTQGFRDPQLSPSASWKSVDMNIGPLSHYYAKSGLNSALGMEMSANGNMQTLFSFMRGAGRQYGVPYWADISEFTRFGYKRQDCAQAANTTNPCQNERCLNGTSGQTDGGTDCGTSYSLAKRAMLHCILWDSAWCGFADELGCSPDADAGVCQQVRSDELGGYLSPFGLIQQGAKHWVAKHAGSLGVQVSTTALLLDSFQGWVRPSDVCWGDYSHGYLHGADGPENAWGNIRWQSHDYFVHHVLDTAYPGYVNGAFFRNESGTFSPTPFGDSVDVVLSDVHETVLAMYDTVVVAGLLFEEPRESSRKLSSFVQRGGRLVITADSLRQLPGVDLGGTAGLVRLVEGDRNCTHYPAGTKVTFADGSANEEPHSFTACALEGNPVSYGPKALNQAHAVDLATIGPTRIAVEYLTGSGGGSVVVLGAVDFGVSSEILPQQRNPCVRNKTGLGPDDNIAYRAQRPLSTHVHRLLRDTLRETSLFDLGESLAWVVKRVAQTEWILAVSNPELNQKPLNIRSNIGAIQSMEELHTNFSVNASTPGWVAAGYAHSGMLGKSTNETIAGVDMRIFRITLAPAGSNTTTALKQLRADAAMPVRYLRFAHGLGDLHQAILARPSFKNHFRGLIVDSEFVMSRSTRQLQQDGSWLAQNNLSIAVDMSRVLNVYPLPPRAYRMFKFMPVEYNESMTYFLSLVRQLPVLGAKDLILSLHRASKTSPDAPPAATPEYEAEVTDTVRQICGAASAVGVGVHLRQAAKNEDYIMGGSGNVSAMLDWINTVAMNNLQVAPQTGLLLKHNSSAQALPPLYSSARAKFLLVAGYDSGVAGQANHYGSDFSNTAVAKMGMAEQDGVRAYVSAVKGAPILVYDAAFSGWEEVLDDVAATSTL